jgi:CRISPR-associated protein (TIGR03984 family)
MQDDQTEETLKAFVSLQNLNSEVSKGVLESQLTSQSALHEHLMSQAQILTKPDAKFLWLLVYLDYRVFWGCYQNGNLELDGKLEREYLQELRLFGRSGEYYLWRNGNQFNWRLRIDRGKLEPAKPKKKQDGVGEDEGYDPPADNIEPNLAEEWQVLWGTQLDLSVEAITGWTPLTEERGLQFQIPHIVTNQNTQLPLRLLVRHYLTYDEAGLCLYEDSRMVELRDKDLQPLITLEK